MSDFTLWICNFLFSLAIIIGAFFTGFFIWFLILKIIKLITKKQIRVKLFSIIGGALFLTIYMIIAIIVAFSIKKTEYNLIVDHEFENSSEYKIAVIADLHYNEITNNENHLKKICDKVSSEKPDIVFLCGDIVDENTKYEQMVFAFENLSQIYNKYGIYFVYGNHDNQNLLKEKYRKYTNEDLKNTIICNGIKLLRDEFLCINGDINLIGRDSNVNEDILSLDSYDNQITDDKYKIVLAHEPIKKFELNDADLFISGHTHDGQVWPFNLVLGLKYINSYMYGKYDSDTYTYIVSSGIGSWAIPARTSSPAEYVIINLKDGN